MKSSFVVGQKYTRDSIRSLLGLGPMRGGQWATGYTSHNGAWFLFVNVAIAGRTGHNYGNSWIDGKLNWFARTNSNLRHPEIKKLLEPGAEVHIFTREHDRDPFLYEGLGYPVEVKDSIPVNVLWGIFEPEDFRFEVPEKFEIEEGFFEGVTKQVKVNKFERDPQARLECIRTYGVSCSVCSMQFSEVYGEIGLNFIHVHHLVPLSAIRRGYRVDPIQDLRPVCPNCHAMLHRRRPPLSIDELKTELRSKK